MPNDEVKLLPCPFCGGYPVTSDRTIWCPNKDCWGPNVENYADMDDAITAWNRRAIPSTVSGETKSNYPEITDGWRMVPIEPTDEQIAAGLESLASSTGEPILHIVRDALFAYRSMVRSAPANPAETQAVEVGK